MLKHTIGIPANARIINFVTAVSKAISGKVRHVELRKNEIGRQEKGAGPTPRITSTRIF